MLYCKKCLVSVRGARESCPLCQGPLAGEPEPQAEVFPNPLPDHGRFLLRLLFFATVIAAAVCVSLDIMVPAPLHWSTFVVLGLACAWLSAAVVIRKRRNIPKVLVWEVFILSGLSLLWDAYTGWRGWSLDFAVPCLCIAAMVVLAILARTMKMEIDDYMIYFLIDALFGVAPLVLLLTGTVGIIYPSVICVMSSAVSIIGLLIFEGRMLWAEMVRRLHL